MNEELSNQEQKPSVAEKWTTEALCWIGVIVGLYLLWGGFTGETLDNRMQKVGTALPFFIFIAALIIEVKEAIPVLVKKMVDSNERARRKEARENRRELKQTRQKLQNTRRELEETRKELQKMQTKGTSTN